MEIDNYFFIVSIFQIGDIKLVFNWWRRGAILCMYNHTSFMAETFARTKFATDLNRYKSLRFDCIRSTRSIIIQLILYSCSCKGII